MSKQVVGVSISVDGQARDIDIRNVTATQSSIFQKATGVGLMEAMQHMSELHVLAALYWFARYTSGEPTLTYKQVVEAFPTWGSFNDRVTIDILEEGEDDESDPLS